MNKENNIENKKPSSLLITFIKFIHQNLIIFKVKLLIY